MTDRSFGDGREEFVSPEGGAGRVVSLIRVKRERVVRFAGAPRGDPLPLRDAFTARVVAGRVIVMADRVGSPRSPRCPVRGNGWRGPPHRTVARSGHSRNSPGRRTFQT